MLSAPSPQSAAAERQAIITRPDSGSLSSAIWHGSEIAWIVVVCFLFGSGAAPDVNEPHYLTKARHFWDPTFAPHDFFLGSRNAHLVYYWLFGWVTTFVTFPAAAWIGRFVGWTLLAVGWQRLSWTVLPRHGASILGVAAWLSLISSFQMSGEWIVGGVEAKLFAYGLVLLGYAEWIRGRAIGCYALLGAASALHVLVGGWAVVMLLFGQWLLPREDRPARRDQLVGLCLGGLLSLAGLVPALQLNAGVSPDVAAQSTRIYVYGRLAHHLLIRDFPSLFVLRHVLLITVFLALWRIMPRRPSTRRLACIVWAALTLVLIGAAVDALFGHMTFGAQVMRYYWFRASDIFLPLGVAILGLLSLMQLAPTRPLLVRSITTLLATILLCNIGYTAWRTQLAMIPAADWQGKISGTAHLSDWRDACHWIQQHTPTDALFLTPPDHQTFKWYAHRAEVVTWKDVPQDAISLVEWSNRLKSVRAWHASTTAADSDERYRNLRRDYSFDYVVLSWPAVFPVPDLPTVYQNSHYRICLATLPE
jgi:hypothetical protein